MGYPLIFEKPPGRNKDEITAIYYAAKKSGVSVRTTFNRRYTPLVLKLSGKELVSSTEMFEESEFYEENRSFFEYVRSGGKAENDILSGIVPVEIADCIRKRIPFYETKKYL